MHGDRAIHLWHDELLHHRRVTDTLLPRRLEIGHCYHHPSPRAEMQATRPAYQPDAGRVVYNFADPRPIAV